MKSKYQLNEKSTKIIRKNERLRWKRKLIASKMKFPKVLGEMVKGLSLENHQRRNKIEATYSKAMEVQGLRSGGCTTGWNFCIKAHQGPKVKGHDGEKVLYSVPRWK